MRIYNIYNNGHDSKINCNFPDGRTKCKKLEFQDLKNYLAKKVTINELGQKYFNRS